MAPGWLSRELNRGLLIRALLLKSGWRAWVTDRMGLSSKETAMIKVTRQGTLVESKFEGRCNRCHTEIECDKGDLIAGPPDLIWELETYYVNCPTSSQSVRVCREPE